MRIGFAGVATSHPYTLARLARTEHNLAVWEVREINRLIDFTARFAPAEFMTLDALLDWKPDVVVVTARPTLVPDIVARVLGSGVPCVVSKVAAASLESLDALSRAIGSRGDQFMTSSVLRFAPAISGLKASIEDRSILEVSIVVAHDIGIFLEGDRRWQDDPHNGGGTAVSLGVHGWDIASVLLDAPLDARAGMVRERRYPTRSEDGAVLEAVARGDQVVSVTIEGVAQRERYEVTVRTNDGAVSAELGGGNEDESLGYVRYLDALLAFGRTGIAPIPWQVSRNVIETSIRAAVFARDPASRSRQHPTSEPPEPWGRD